MPFRKPRLVLTTNIPTPYRLAFFDVLAPRLLDRGIEFEVLFYASTEPDRHWTLNLTAVPYPCKILPGIHPHFPGFYPHLNPTLPFELRSRAPTWVLVAGAWITPSSLMASSRRVSGSGYRLFWSEAHAQAVLHPEGFIATLRRRVLRTFDGFAVPNQGSADYLAGELGFAPTCLRLPNTVNEAFYLENPGATRTELRAKLGLTESDVVLLCVALLADHKGVLELTSAVSALPDPLKSKVRLVFAGDGPLREAIAATGCAPVRLLGHLAPDSVRDWLYAADYFVLPSKLDRNPLSAIEAAFCGLPLLLSARVGNARDLVPGSGHGWLFPRIDAASMVDVLIDALSVPAEVRREIGERTRQLAIEQFSRARVAERFIDELCREYPAPQSSRVPG